MRTNRFELRTGCFYDYEEDVLLEVEYLCEMDSHPELSEEKIIKTCGSIKKLGYSKDKTFFKFGIYPVRIILEEHGKVCRMKQNHLINFKNKEGNIYIADNDGMGIFYKIQKLAE